MLRPFRTNNQIRIAQVQVIDESGAKLGVMRTSDALRLAQDKDLDLVEVGPTAEPPIAKIMDYGKYIYQKEKQEKKSGARHREQETKTVRVGFKTGEHDLQFKAKKADEFLGLGHIVKLELTLRGREKGLAGLGKEKLMLFLKKLEQPIVAQGTPLRSPYGWVIMVQLDKKAAQVSHKPTHQHEDKKGAVQARQDNGNGENPQAPAESKPL